MSTPATSSRWTDDLLDPLRHVGDPLADNAVGQLFAGGNVQAVNSMMQMLVANDGVVSGSLPPVIRDYLAQTGQLPSWADAGKIRAGEHLFWRYGPEMVGNLLLYSLPFCYAGRNGVQVLSLTTRLYSNPTRRVIETAQMVIDVMQPGGLAAGGAGLRTAQKVRLMHAGIRYQIKAYPAWNPAWGLPINQEDLAGTLMSFSWIVLDGLRRLGFPISADEAEAYVHCWNVVGHVLGVRPELLPESDADAGALAHKISERQFGASPEGQDLTRALIEMIQHYIPGNLLDSVPPSMTRWFLGDACADYLGVARANAAVALLEPLGFVNRLVGTKFKTVEPLGRVHEIFSRRLIESFLWVERGGKRIPFTIPTELRQAWGINWTA